MSQEEGTSLRMVTSSQDCCLHVQVKDLEEEYLSFSLKGSWPEDKGRLKREKVQLQVGRMQEKRDEEIDNKKEKLPDLTTSAISQEGHSMHLTSNTFREQERERRDWLKKMSRRAKKKKWTNFLKKKKGQSNKNGDKKLLFF